MSSRVAEGVMTVVECCNGGRDGSGGWQGVLDVGKENRVLRGWGTRLMSNRRAEIEKVAEWRKGGGGYSLLTYPRNIALGQLCRQRCQRLAVGCVSFVFSTSTRSSPFNYWCDYTENNCYYCYYLCRYFFSTLLTSIEK